MAFSSANLPSSPGVYCWSAGRFRGGGDDVVTGAERVMGCGRVVRRKGVKGGVGLKMEGGGVDLGVVGLLGAGGKGEETGVTKSLGLTKSLVTLCLTT